MLSVFRTFGLRWPIIAALCGALTLVSGCSTLRIAYATAPDLVYWWLDRYVDFNDTQTPRVRDAIQQWFVWHRRTQLPDYAALLVRAQQDVLLDTTPARACEWQAEWMARARTAFDRIAPAAAELMPTITPQQIVHLEERYAKANAKFRDDYLDPDPAQRADAARKRTVDRAEMLYGSLEQAQRDLIDDRLARSPFDPERWLSERRARQQDALQILRQLSTEGASREQALVALKGYVDRLERSPREDYRRYHERLTEYNCAFAASLHNAASAAQRRTAARRLAGWEGDLRAIAAASASGSAEPAPNAY